MRWVLGLCCLLFGCAGGSALRESDRSMDSSHGISPAVLREDRAIYASRCGGCHRLYPADRHPASEWGAIVERMREYAPLEDEEVYRIKRYLNAVAPR